MSYDLENFTLKDMAICSSWLRKAGKAAADMETVANSIVSYFHEQFLVSGSGQKACALVRFFITHSYGTLSQDRRAIVQAVLGGAPKDENVQCLTLLATVGEKAEWNSVRHSVGHQAIPLTSHAMIEQAPMIAQLIRQFGIDTGMILSPAPDLIMEAAQKTYNVFHVPQAQGSPYIPAQKDFVVPNGIRSVLGFGGVLPSGSLFAIIVFSRVPVSSETANLFKTLSMSVKAAVLPFEGPRVFNRTRGGRAMEPS